MRMVLVIVMTWGAMGYMLVPHNFFDDAQSNLGLLIATR